MITYVKNYGIAGRFNWNQYKYLFMESIHRVCHQIGLLRFPNINFKIVYFHTCKCYVTYFVPNMHEIQLCAKKAGHEHPPDNFWTRC